MANLKLKIKKTLMKRKIEGVVVEGYYGRVITNGRIDFGTVAVESTKNTTLHPAEAELAAKLFLEGVCERIKQGQIVDLGPLGRLYPAVNSKWETDPDNLVLNEMMPKVNYKASDDIAGAVKSATLSWAAANEEDGNDTPGGENNGGGTTTPTGDDPNAGND